MESAIASPIREAVAVREWWKKDTLLVSLFFILGLLSRIPFQSRRLYYWDSVNYALATKTFDLRIHQPQPPGYIIYVLLGRAVNLLTGDPQTSFVWLSILFTGLSASAIYLLGTKLFSSKAGIVAVALLLSSPLVWFHGEVAVPHVLDSFFVMIVVLLLYEVDRGRMGFLLPAAFILGMVTGLRQQTVLFLLPLAIYSCRSVGLRRLGSAAICFGLTAAFWQVPLVWLSGGVFEYLKIVNADTSQFGFFDAIRLLAQGDASVLLNNTGSVARYTAYGLSLAFLPLAACILRNPVESLSSLRTERGLVLLLWLAPSLVFYVFVHIGRPGHIFIYLPALLLISAAALVRLSNGMRSEFLPLALVGIMALNGYLFLFAPEHLLGEDRVKVLNRSSITNQDAYYDELVRLVRTNFSPNDTILMGSNWRQVEYYLPEYQSFRLPLSMDQELGLEGDSGPVNLDPALQVVRTRAANIVYFDKAQPVAKGASFGTLKGRSGAVLYYLQQKGE